MNVNNINLNDLQNIDLFIILYFSQIFLCLKYKPAFSEENFKTSNNVLEIQNVYIIRGQIEKSVLGDGSKGLIQRICMI